MLPADAMSRPDDDHPVWSSRYWHQRGSRKWTFCSDKEEIFRPMDVKIKRHVKVIGTKNPYIDTEYFHNKQKNRKYERGYRDKSFAM